MFEDTRDGFHITFANGWTVSVQWHKYAYSNENNSTAEIAAWDSNGDWYRHSNGDTVEGWASPERVAEFVSEISKL